MTVKVDEWRKTANYYGIRSDERGLLSGIIDQACNRIEMLEDVLREIANTPCSASLHRKNALEVLRMGI